MFSAPNDRDCDEWMRHVRFRAMVLDRRRLLVRDMKLFCAYYDTLCQSEKSLLETQARRYRYLL